MKRDVTAYDFRRAFEECRPDNFSYAGLEALYDYLTSLEDDCGEEIELDVIAFCCDFSEYESAWDAMKEYQPDDMPVVDLEEMVGEDGVGPDLMEVEEAQEEAALEWLRDHTTVIEFDGGVIIHCF